MPSGIATVLIVGSHPVILDAVVGALRNHGYQVVRALGPDEGMAALDGLEPDVMVLGGPNVLAERAKLIGRLVEKSPYARVIVPGSPGHAVDAVHELFTSDMH